MSSKLLDSITARTVALVALSGSALLLVACGKSPVAAGPHPAGPPTVGVVLLKPENVPLAAELPGRTSAYQIAEVRPQVGGLIQSRRFREGGDVKAGDVLYEIDPATYQAAVSRAQAALAKAEANRIPVRAKAERYKELAAIHAISQQDGDDAAAALKQVEAEVLSARATLESERISLERTRITAPISGRTGRSSVTAGALVAASQSTALVTVQQLDPIYVDLTQSSTSMLQLKRALEVGALRKSAEGGTKVRLLLEDGSSYAPPGKLQFSESTVDPATGAVTLRAVFPNPKGELLPGMYVRAVFEAGVQPGGLLVPQRAVQRDAAGKPTAYAVGPDGKLELRQLVTDRAVGDAWLVTHGLSVNERVVVDGLQNARPGSAVNAVPWTPRQATPAASLATGS